MADKIVLGNIASFQNDSTASTQYNANNTLLISALDNTLSRDGTSPNQMAAPLDMNSQPIINLPAPTTLDEPLRLADINSIISVIPSFVMPTFIRYAFKGINFNSANTDNALTFTLPAGISRYRFNNCNISNASASITTATAGVFSAVSGGGIALANNQALTVSQSVANTNSNTMGLVINNGNTEAYNLTTLYFRIGTAQGTAATADVIITLALLT